MTTAPDTSARRAAKRTPPATPKLTEAEFDRVLKNKRATNTAQRLREAHADAERNRALNTALCERIDALQIEREHLLMDQRIAVVMFTGLGMAAGFLAGLFYAGF